MQYHLLFLKIRKNPEKIYVCTLIKRQAIRFTDSIQTKCSILKVSVQYWVRGFYSCLNHFINVERNRQLGCQQNLFDQAASSLPEYMTLSMKDIEIGT